MVMVMTVYVIQDTLETIVRQILTSVHLILARMGQHAMYVSLFYCIVMPTNKNGYFCFQDLVAGFNCSCLPGYFGIYCETDADECANMPCAHGSCVVSVFIMNRHL